MRPLVLALLACAVALPAAHAQTVADSVEVAEPAPRPRPRPVARPRTAPSRSAGTGAHRLSGPRVGLTLLSPDNVREINRVFGDCTRRDPYSGTCENSTVISPGAPVITQFGWQFERPMAETANGLTIVTELVGLVGGLERGILLPSGSLIVGVRTARGLEFGLGPNLSATGAGYAITAGFANPVGDINVPVNIAAVLGKGGPRISLLVGLTFAEGRY